MTASFDKTQTGLDTVCFGRCDGVLVGETPHPIPVRQLIEIIKTEVVRLEKDSSCPDHIRAMAYTLKDHLSAIEDLVRKAKPSVTDMLLLVRYAITSGYLFRRLQLAEAEYPAAIGRKVHAAAKKPRRTKPGTLRAFIETIPGWRKIAVASLVKNAITRGFKQNPDDLRRQIRRFKNSGH